MPKAHPKQAAVVIEGPRYRTVVRVTATGEEIDVTSRMQQGYDVGTKGWVQYRSGPFYGLYFFTPSVTHP